MKINILKGIALISIIVIIAGYFMGFTSQDLISVLITIILLSLGGASLLREEKVFGGILIGLGLLLAIYIIL
ncbi:hypothetical protein LF817_14250 [Halobacillus sp. A1]|uniref:hypothetical protein n=1 Tax=Halobacillus sp. A1 TaxID=2880262 RepID=UPI0020A68C7E|nr:hypothetical protein [Halobacillus sp. A1]MCP3032485.1 hypothetical protein [Halobacillus sp. A1]